MKKLYSLLIGAPALAGAAFGLAGCVGDGAVGVGVDVGPGYYDEGPWAYGHPYYHEHDHFIGGGGYGGGWGRPVGHGGEHGGGHEHR